MPSVVKLGVIMLGVVMLGVIMLDVIMQGVIMKDVVMLGVVMQSIVKLSIVAPTPVPQGTPERSTEAALPANLRLGCKCLAYFRQASLTN
jgi:hypothetical protein